MSDLHATLVAAVTQRLDTARAAEHACWHVDYCDDEMRAFHDANGPTAVILACEADLERLEEHRPIYQIPRSSDGGLRWVCKQRCRQEACAEVYRIARVHGVEVTS